MDINIKLNHNFTAAFNKLKTDGGEVLSKLNGFSESQLSYTDFIDHFVDKNTVADASIDGNANVGAKDVCSLLSETNKPHMKLLAFNKIFFEMNKKWGFQTANDWLRQEYNGAFYLHDAPSSTFVSYCYAYDLQDLAEKGLYFIDGFNSQPPEHLETWTDFVGEFVSWTSNRTSGACGLPSFLVYSYYFWKKDCESGHVFKNPEYYRDQEFQRIIYKLNQPYLRVNQSAFTNFSIFDESYLVELFGGKTYPDGSFIIDAIPGILDYQKRFMEVLGDIRAKNAMTFPVMTYSLLFNSEERLSFSENHELISKVADSVLSNLTDKYFTGTPIPLATPLILNDSEKKQEFIDNVLFCIDKMKADGNIDDKTYEMAKNEFDADELVRIELAPRHFINEEYAKWCCKQNMRWGDSNFAAFESVTSLSNCCRLSSDIKQLGYFNSIGGTDLSVGSVKVNTINLARISYESQTQEQYLKILRDRVQLSLKCLDTVRGIIKRNAEKNLLPNYKKNVISMANQYNTIGILGIFETLETFNLIRVDEFGYHFYTDDAIRFAKKILSTIHEESAKFRKENNCDYHINIEQVPAERAASILMAKDKIFFPEQKYTLPLYANQWIPLAVKTTIQEKARISAILDKACNGGSIAHINIATPFKTFDEAWEILNMVARSGVKYFAFCYRISVCEHNHSFFGDTCPYCGKPKYTTVIRIVGFLVPEKNFSQERKEEQGMRYFFELE